MKGKLPQLLRWLVIVAAGAGFLGVRAVQVDHPAPSDAPIEVAVTVDDLPRMAIPNSGSADVVLHRLVTAFQRHHLPPVTGFVNGKRLEEHPEDRAALREWLAAGNRIGNHTYSHPDLAKTSLAEFSEDVRRNEAVLESLQPGHDWRVFRYPFLQEGASESAREAARSYLFSRGYRIAEVTVDFEDWQWFPIFHRCHADDRDVEKLRARYRRAARDTLLDSDRQARTLFGRRIRQVLLIHAGEFTADMIDDLLEEYEAMGVRFVSLDDAMQDTVYHLDPRFARNWGSPFLYQVRTALRGEDPNAKWPPYPELASYCQ
ncbi:MAG TPA: polysaccharide deacetylase family protein [Myxococcota bacterium]|nr:polysaccharide deacetylase family protein [Myxococcota bacterium]